MVKYRSYKPAGVLSEYVRLFWSLEARVDGTNGPFVHRALPDNCIELIFYCDGKLAIASADGEEGYTFSSGIFGHAQKFRQFKSHDSFHLFGVYLYPSTLRILFNLPASELLNQKIDSETLWGSAGKILEEQVITATRDKDRVQAVSNFLLKKISNVREYENAFRQKVNTAIDNNKLLSIDSFADQCNLSRRQFERKFNEFSGFTPKEFFSIVRFKNALHELSHGRSLAQTAMDCGYYDQSHFSNEFKRLSGYSPREFAIHHSRSQEARASVDFK